MILYNYSSLRKRDAKIYNIGGYNLAGGFSIEFLKIVVPVAFIILLIGFILSFIVNVSMFNFFADNFSLWYLIIFLGLGIGAGCALWYIKFSGYRLYQYLYAYIKPKKAYSNDFKNKEYRLTNIKINAIVKNIL